MDYKDFQAGVQQKNFWFKGKEGLIQALLEKLPPQKNAKILNIGAGTGDDLAIINQFGNIYAIDIEENALALIPNNLVTEKKVGDACTIPYDDNSFHIAVAFDVLEHVEHDQKMIDEINRILKPGGHFVFTVPAYNILYSQRDKELGHYRRYNKKMLKKLLQKLQRKTLGSWFSSLFPAAGLFLCMPKKFQQLFSSKANKQSFHNFPKWIDTIMYHFLKIENWFIKKGAVLPFGLTVYGIYQKTASRLSKHKI